MNVLVVFGTTEGQTRKVAERAAEDIRRRRHRVEVYDSAAPAFDFRLEDFDAFIVAASVHQEQHQEGVVNFATAHRGILDAKPSALISVSLSAVVEGGRAEAQRYVDRFVSVTGWQPRMTLLLGGALRLTEYDYFQEQIVKFIVMKDESASAAGDREFTDWEALSGFVRAFLDAAKT